jgi:ubiquinone biosynthesis protein COQ9
VADLNHYTKRAILSGVYGSTLMAFLDDESADFAETHAFLERRIDNVMQFEKAKAKWTSKGESLSLSRFLGRLRYPAR